MPILDHVGIPLADTLLVSFAENRWRRMDWLHGFVVLLCPRCTFLSPPPLSLETIRPSLQEYAASVSSSVDEVPEHEAKLREMLASLPSKVEGERGYHRGNVSWRLTCNPPASALLEAFYENFCWK
jgi:hypothetical protein